MTCQVYIIIRFDKTVNTTKTPVDVKVCRITKVYISDSHLTLMDEGEIISQIQSINSEFYQAFESLSIERMERIWKHEDKVICVHPGWDLFIGWFAIRDSWVTIFRNTDRIKFVLTNTKVRVFDASMAVVVCLENIETLLNGQSIRYGVIASNIYEQMQNQWLLVHHHGSPVSNYMPPNISSSS